jgi:high-affinity nickel permease
MAQITQTAKSIFFSLVLFFGLTLPTLGVVRAAGIQDGLTQIKDQFPNQSEIGQSEDVGQVIVAVIKMLFLLLFAVSVLFILIGGFQYVTSAGKEEQAKKGRQTLTYAVIGLAISILAYVIVYAVTNSLTGPEV